MSGGQSGLLRTYGIPEAMSAAVCAFPKLDQAVACVTAVIQLGVPVARAELLDEMSIDAVNRRSNLGLKTMPTILFEFHGSEGAVQHDAEEVVALAREFGAESVESATSQQDRNRLWRARHEAYYAALALRPGSKGLVTDVCVPVSRLAECISETRADIAKTDLLAPILGHVGDGNFHVTFLIDPNSEDELARAQEINRRMVSRAIAMGGTCSGEHGVGYGKAEFLRAEHGEALDVMAAIKKALDPMGILNPGKMTQAAL